jgi:hypothetical protein
LNIFQTKQGDINVNRLSPKSSKSYGNGLSEYIILTEAKYKAHTVRIAGENKQK